MSLFSLETERPKDTATVRYVKFGPTFGKTKFYQFLKEFKKSTGFELDSAVYSRMILERTTVDSQPYYELSLHKEIFLPIAGRQSSILERHAEKAEMSLVGFADTFNFILNDSRI